MDENISNKCIAPNELPEAIMGMMRDYSPATKQLILKECLRRANFGAPPRAKPATSQVEAPV